MGKKTTFLGRVHKIHASKRGYLEHVFQLCSLCGSIPRYRTPYYIHSAAAMPASAVQIAKRAFVQVLLDLAVFKLRVKRLLKTRKAQTVAGNCARGLKKVCKEVSDRGGGAARS